MIEGDTEYSGSFTVRLDSEDAMDLFEALGMTVDVEAETGNEWLDEHLSGRYVVDE